MVSMRCAPAHHRQLDTVLHVTCTCAAAMLLQLCLLLQRLPPGFRTAQQHAACACALAAAEPYPCVMHTHERDLPLPTHSPPPSPVAPTALQLLQRQQQQQALPAIITGCQQLDALLGGGIHPGTVTEFCECSTDPAVRKQLPNAGVLSCLSTC
jgi:hypothetical protein